MLPTSLRTRLVLVLAGSFAAILAGGMALVSGWVPITGADVPGWLLPLAALAELGALVLVADYAVRRFVLGPLGQMASVAREIAGGDHQRRVEETGPRELRDLGGSINRMADRLLEDRRRLAENVSSLQEVNRALTETRDELIQAEKLASVGRMAAGLAHEIGNPLNSIITYVDVGERRGGEGDWLDGIREEARRIDRIIRGLLDFARPGDPVVDRHDANSIVRETLELLESQGKLEGIGVDTDLDRSLPDVWVSPVRLEQVLVNLLLNAVDALDEVDGERRVAVRSRFVTYQGPPDMHRRVRRSDDPEEVDYSHLRRFHSEPSPASSHGLDPGDRVVAVEVVDTGPGLQVDPPEKVFDPFYTTKEPGRGTGLGLAVSARLVERMGGTIVAENREDGRGSCFRVLLPTERPVEEDPGADGETAGRESEDQPDGGASAGTDGKVHEQEGDV